jgi:hypothetical protein
MSASVKASYSGIERSAAVTLNPASLLSLTTPATIGGGQTVTGTINLDGLPSSPILVTLESLNPAVASVPVAPLSVSNRTLNFNIVTVAQGTGVDVVFTARAGAIEVTSTSTITPPPVQSLALDRTRVSGNTVVTGTVTMASTIGSRRRRHFEPEPGRDLARHGHGSRRLDQRDVHVHDLDRHGADERQHRGPHGYGDARGRTLRDARGALRLSLPATSVIAGAALNGTVTLTQAASAGGTTVNLSASWRGRHDSWEQVLHAGVSSLPVPITARGGERDDRGHYRRGVFGVTVSRSLTIEPRPHGLHAAHRFQRTHGQPPSFSMAWRLLGRRSR